MKLTFWGLVLHGFLTAMAMTAIEVQAQTQELGHVLDARALGRVNDLPRLRSLLISIDGELVEEHYFNGARASQTANLKSASKSLLSALVGIALERGYLKSVKETIGKFFPEYLRDADDAKKKAITIEDLLTMRSGLESTSNVNYGHWVQSGNWVRYVLARPLVDEPGERMSYSTGNSHLLSAILTRATGVSTFEFVRRYLADPLGISIAPWMRDPQGIYLGGNEMHWTPRGMLAFGALYLNGGRTGNKQVVSETWVKESFKPRARSRWSGREYGYGWWIDSMAGHATYYAWGHGGQFIFVVPALKLVVVTTSSPSPGDGRREHQRAIYDLMEYDIIPAVENRRAVNRSQADAIVPATFQGDHQARTVFWQRLFEPGRSLKKFIEKLTLGGSLFAAVHVNNRAAHEAGCVRGEKKSHAGDFIGSTRAAESDSLYRFCG